LKAKCEISFYLHLLSETFLILRVIQQDTTINVFRQSSRFSRQILMKLEFSRQLFDKRSNTIFLYNPPTRSRVVLCGRPDRQTKLIIVFPYFANAPKNCTFCPRRVFMFCTYPRTNSRSFPNWLFFITET
jgi:hypothetical protein